MILTSTATLPYLDSTSHDILSDDWKEPPDESRREQYADYIESVGHRYPRKLELLVNGSKVVTARVESLSTTAFEDAVLTPPKDAIGRRQCTGMKHAAPISTPDPRYPKSASQNGLMGDTTVTMTVHIDGVRHLSYWQSCPIDGRINARHAEALEIQAGHMRIGACSLGYSGGCQLSIGVSQ